MNCPPLAEVLCVVSLVVEVALGDVVFGDVVFGDCASAVTIANALTAEINASFLSIVCLLVNYSGGTLGGAPLPVRQLPTRTPVPGTFSRFAACRQGTLWRPDG